MLQRTFQLIPGVGPWRERDLWARGVREWSEFPSEGAPVCLSRDGDVKARNRLIEAQAALDAKDLGALARMIPAREHWRLYREFADDAVFFDIETDGVEVQAPTVVSLFDRDGLQVFILGRNMDELPAALAKRRLWVTFNGSCYDVPILHSYFGSLPKPAAHIDLRFVCRRLRVRGGLKTIEDHLGIGRPPHLKGVNGMDAVILWRAYRDTGNLDALRMLVEYNLYDSFNLRSVLELTWNRAVADLNFDGPHCTVFERGDILYDVSKLVLALGPTERDLDVLKRLRPQDRQLAEG